MRSARQDKDKTRGAPELLGWLVAVGFFFLLAAASIGGPTRVWTVPERAGTTAVVDQGDPVVPVTTIRPQGSNPNGVELTLAAEVIIVLFIVAFIVAGLVSAWALGLPVSTWRPRRPRARHRAIDTVLPDPIEPAVRVDIDAVQAALVEGDSRDAIIRCWMQVQSDITDAGHSPVPSETSTEYVERVIAESSVDPRPIANLAALYRESRFSEHELTEAHRSRAAEAVRDVAASLHPVEAGQSNESAPSSAMGDAR